MWRLIAVSSEDTISFLRYVAKFAIQSDKENDPKGSVNGLGKKNCTRNSSKFGTNAQMEYKWTTSLKMLQGQSITQTAALFQQFNRKFLLYFHCPH